MPNKYRDAGAMRGVEGKAKSVIGPASMPSGSGDLGGSKAQRPKDATAALAQPKETPVVKVPIDRSKNLGTFLHKGRVKNEGVKGTDLQENQVRANKIESE